MLSFNRNKQPDFRERPIKKIYRHCDKQQCMEYTYFPNVFFADFSFVLHWY